MTWRVQQTGEAASGDLHAMLLSHAPALTAYRLTFVAESFLARLNGRMEAERGIAGAQFAVMFCLSVRDGTTAQEIADATQRPKNSLSRAVRALEAKGLIERRQDPDDQRRQPMGLSPEGRRLFRRLEALAADQESAMLAPLTSEERKTLAGLLMRMAGTY